MCILTRRRSIPGKFIIGLLEKTQLNSPQEICLGRADAVFAAHFLQEIL